MTIPITWNATDLAAGVRDIRGKWVNSPYYRGGSVEWNPLASSFLSDGAGWQTSECPVIVRAPRLATQSISFVNGVAWDVHGSTSIAAAQNELLVSHPNASPVEGIVLEGRESQVLYQNAIMDGVDLAVGIWHGRGPRAEHIYVIRRMPSGDSEFIEIESIVNAVGSRVAGWDGATLLEIGNTSIVDRQDDRRGWTLRPAVAWYYDADGAIVKTPIVARMEYLSRGNVKVTKFVPRSLIATALAARENGELRCDLTGTFYPDANPESTTHDGYTGYVNNSGISWSSIRSQTNSTVSDDSTSPFICGINMDTPSNTWDAFYRAQTSFDLTSLSGNVATDATYSIKCSSIAGQTLTGQSINITQMTPASWTGVSLSDYGAAGSSGTKLAADIAVSGLSTTVYTDFSLNASGVSAVTSSMGSRIGISVRVASEIDNSEPAWIADKLVQVNWAAAEAAGTTTDPKLVVTYTSGGGSIAAISKRIQSLRRSS